MSPIGVGRSNPIEGNISGNGILTAMIWSLGLLVEAIPRHEIDPKVLLRAAVSSSLKFRGKAKFVGSIFEKMPWVVRVVLLFPCGDGTTDLILGHNARGKYAFL
jgi:hypothetical protein